MSKTLITGCGRSGTTYIVKLLKKLGVNAVQEYLTPSRMNADSFPHKVEASGYGVAFLKKLSGKVRVALQIRHPVLVVRRHVWSWTEPKVGMLKKFPIQNNMYRAVFGKNIPGETIVEKASNYVCHWNKEVERYMETMPNDMKMCYRIEDIDNVFYNLWAFIHDRPFDTGEEVVLDNKEYDKIKHALASVSKATNSKVKYIKDNYSKEDRSRFETLGFDDLTTELQEYLLKWDYDKEPERPDV